ncbi:autotransporter outer membrane beta-barrel domain-containing protein [Thalassospira indica]|uniref:autotransporter outer membrane beta-barrel domain-containing protein n=1 Tax=Thalassospira indica TaxID=1891279 RepID=UPI0007FBBFBD|nr:autotransporter outer membrane beta-barrel domain-containing protein [Thalassospira indica]OAZ14163.1 hypothetical protein TH15_08035 [Thalassospira profundimaris]
MTTSALSDARAAKCSADGGLLFVGKTADSARSVWLSGTSAGAFRLDAQGATKDTWTESRRGLHLTLSDVVSTGNGGTHHLYDNSGGGCLLDSQNQKGGVNLPPIGDLFPDFVMPELPGQVTPPIATLPPTGIMPSLPPGVAPPVAILPPDLPGGGTGITPPIGTLPPEGVMPTVPGAVTPPIGVLPPDGGTGITPPIGTLPPEGVMPTVPGGVTPPIGTLPPEGVTPTVPGAVTPPIGTLPPEGVMPTLPGGVTPPIGVLPPDGGTGITPPIGVLPPGGGGTDVTPVTPTAPGGVSETVANAQLRKGGAEFLPEDTCAVLDRDGQFYRTDQGLVFTAPCALVRQGGYTGVTVASITGQSDVPLTPGREFFEEPLWNFWSEARGIYANDRRHSLDTTAFSGSFLFGVDREIAEDTVAGVSASFESSSSEGFNNNLETSAYGMSVGPYIAHRLSPEWAIEGSLGYMALHNNLDVLVLEGEYFSHQLSGAAALNGQYRYDNWTFRPRFGISYAETFVEDYDLSGAIAGNPVTVNVGSDHFGYGEAEISGEASKLLFLSEDLIGMPYGELGMQYGFVRPNDGEILSGNLTYQDTSPITGTLRAGMRFVYDDSIFFDVGAGYLSIGQNGLDIWEAKARVSFAF